MLRLENCTGIHNQGTPQRGGQRRRGQEVPRVQANRGGWKAMEAGEEGKEETMSGGMTMPVDLM